jgi:uncharacterized protein YkwD
MKTPAPGSLRRLLALGAIGMLALVLVGCGRSIAAGDPLPNRRGGTSVRPSATAAALEREVFEAVNRHRRTRGLPALALDARIARAARAHSAAMAAGSVPLGHAGFDARVDALRRAMAFRRSAENVAFNQGHRSPASEAVRGWLASRGHRENIEGQYDTTGVGVIVDAAGEVYLTQIFVGR